MNPLGTLIRYGCLAMILLSMAAGQVLAADSNAPALIPAPKSLTLIGGTLAITPANRVLYADEQLKPLAKVLASDIQRGHGLPLSVSKADSPRKGDIVLQLVKEEAIAGHYDSYVLSVADQVTVQAGSYNALAMGMMTVLQAARGDARGLIISRMSVTDYGDRAFRALQVDIRSGYHPPSWVKQVIDVMRLYKVGVLELHTTESMWVGATFESSNAADPKLLQNNLAWSKKDMDDVIAYARDRGVSLVPHNEMRPNDPFWPAALTTDFNPGDKFADFVDEADGKGKFEIKGDLAKDERFWNFVKVATQRSYEQFAKGWPDGKLPYYHIGPVYGEGGCNGKEAVKMLGFLMEKNPDIRMMYWNGPGENDPDLAPYKKNIAVSFYSANWGGTPDGLLAAGYQLVNVSWTPLYILPGSRTKAVRQGKWIFAEFQLTRFGDESTFGQPIKARDCTKWQDGIIGSMLATWEFAGPHAGEGHLEMITPCIPFYAEHIWNVKPYPYSAGAWEKASAAFDQVFYGMRIQVEGLTPETTLRDNNQPNWFADQCVVTLSTLVPDAQIRYTLDGKEAMAESTIYGGPINLHDQATVRARLFDAKGQPLGQEFTAAYELNPVSARTTGLLDDPRYSDPSGRPNTFRDSMTLALQSARAGGTIRYTLDDKDPTSTSPACTGAIAISKPTTVRARWFDAAGKPTGAAWVMSYTNRGYQPSLTTGAKVTCSDDGQDRAANAVDGMVERDMFWGSGSAPQWLQVELAKPAKIAKVQTVFYWDDARYYQYTVEVSMDAKTWTRVVDASKNTQKSTQEGAVHTFDPVEARYLRLTVLKNSANPAIHVVEFRAFGIAP